MDTKSLRENIRAIILGATGFIVFLLLLRFSTELISGPEPENGLLQILFGITDALLSPFLDVIDTGRLDRFNVSALLALGAYILIGIALTELLLAFIQDSFIEIFKNILDLFFKVIESFLLLRLVNDLFLLSDTSVYVRFIADSTLWAAEIFPIDPILEGRFNPGIIIVLIVVGFLDYYTDIFLKRLIRKPESNQNNFSYSKTQRIVSGQNQPQNITINVPPSQQTVVVNSNGEHVEPDTPSHNFYRDGVRN